MPTPVRGEVDNGLAAGWRRRLTGRPCKAWNLQMASFPRKRGIRFAAVAEPAIGAGDRQEYARYGAYNFGSTFQRSPAGRVETGHWICRSSEDRMPRPPPRIPLLAALVLFPAGIASAGAPAIAALDYSADTGANLVDANTFAARKDYVEDHLAGTRLRKQIPGLPDTVNLRDFHVDSNGDFLFALDVGTTLAGTYFKPADVIRYNGTTFAKAFDSTAAGVPASVHCDGVARWGDTGKLLLSFDATFEVGAITIRPSDVIVYFAGAFGPKLVDARLLALPDRLDIGAIDTFRTKDYILVAFKTGGAIAGIPFTTADVMQLHLTDGSWSKRFALSTFTSRWNSAGLDGIAAVNIDTVFQDDFQ